MIYKRHSRRRLGCGRQTLAFCFLIAFFTCTPGSVFAAAKTSETIRSFTEQHCLACHDSTVQKGNLNLEQVLSDDVAMHPDTWEKAVRRLRTRQMPPANKKRPDEKVYEQVLTVLEGALDSAAATEPNPGRTQTLRRLNRTEYRNAIRDLLALEIDSAALLPKDEAGHGFDNVTVGTLSPTLLDRYITASQKISRMAVGSPQPLSGDTFRMPPDLSQEEQVEGLPLGTRGGALIPYTFPHDAEYEIQVRLTRDRNEEVEGLREAHDLEVLLDKQRVARFTVAPPKDRNFDKVDQHLKVRIPVKAGPHQVGVTFIKNSSSLLETKRQPYVARFNMHRHPRIGPAVFQVSINGPYDSKGPGVTPSRQRIFVAKPTKAEDEERCAKENLSALARRAYGRPITDADMEKPMALYRAAAKLDGGYEAGVEAGLSAILVSPSFLFRVEREPASVPSNSAYRISDIELARRLSFFLWSSIPDDELLDVAIRGDLHKQDILEKQTRRMLADPRAKSLVDNFADQWLHLRNLDSLTPDLRLFPDFDDNLRRAFGQETKLFFESILREDRSVTNLLRADYTYMNERLARHYGVPGVYGSQFRRVSTSGEHARGGLLRHASVLAVTSYATRTSPVLRGKWVLENLIGTPPGPPGPDVPALRDNTVLASLSVRERLAEHRANAACASCHILIDPPGFALENFDAVGRWRMLEEGKPVDASGGLPDGSEFTGVAALEEGLLKRPEIFVSTLTEKLLTFALGRGIEHYDAPAVRQIVREAQQQDYRFSSLIVGITRSTPFTMRRSQ